MHKKRGTSFEGCFLTNNERKKPIKVLFESAFSADYNLKILSFEHFSLARISYLKNRALFMRHPNRFQKMRELTNESNLERGHNGKGRYRSIGVFAER